ncbi:hypothetical protein X557_03845 [Francisella tularensis subsp. holarctica PHIT-FT049]|uniref:hypothetical protein n=1 Tax=Francisella tularensis TaxID=263 RepID=UPI00028C71CE|nr:hypothetical protein [Francisella tularensis]AHH46206.1 hypothetical protein X557_03845 [Francisella tularensis subsp. holarctica PHIT-FT049]EKM87447.1 hypothetical protein B345_03521 [Francisella tularensis subsp. tularensis AS_713]EKM87499.1 hypothetical protein B344_03476 [Francisella tularensis subsp. tularensis 831]EKM91551.1 hypothetical protein B341_03516 [Francisella tularensis subsp. tularensis 70102010]EKM92854.1 hypothetical protein B342_03526 [Francisella tularensis subsp. tular
MIRDGKSSQFRREISLKSRDLLRKDQNWSQSELARLKVSYELYLLKELITNEKNTNK